MPKYVNPDPEFYYEEFLRYHEMAKIQQDECNLGTIPHMEGTVEDPLMRHIELYDVVERQYAGFTQIVHDLWSGSSKSHPYHHKLHSVRKPICEAFTDSHDYWGLREWLYVFIIHRVTGSGINYAKKPSGYNNTILPLLDPALELDDLSTHVRNILSGDAPAYTSVGYQFPRFPPKLTYKRGGDRFIVEYAPRLATDLADYLENSPDQPEFRVVADWLFEWNRSNGLTAYRFQYAALLADIADFYPSLIDTHSLFLYGSNAVECISYMTGGKRAEKYLDAVMIEASLDTGGKIYNLEDVACDFIRWVENYIRPGHDYDHVDRDLVWNSSRINTHPFGRQKGMLDMGLIRSFNDLSVHPSDDYVLARNEIEPEHYVSELVKMWST